MDEENPHYQIMETGEVVTQITAKRRVSWLEREQTITIKRVT